VDAELISRVVEQVVAELRRRPTTSPAPSPSPSPAAVAKPPRRAQQTQPGTPTKIFITAEMLSARLAAGEQSGVVELAHNEFLTPNAEDLLAKRHVAVKKAPAPAPIPTADGREDRSQDVRGNSQPPAGAQQGPAAPGGAGRIGLVTDRPDPSVEGLVRALAHDGLPLADFGRDDCWAANIRTMCGEIVSGRLGAGVAILPEAPEAMVLANKIKGIRAVQGTRCQSVRGAVHRFGANVLILEHAFSTFHEMRQMVRCFAAGRPTGEAAGATAAVLAEMER